MKRIRMAKRQQIVENNLRPGRESITSRAQNARRTATETLRVRHAKSDHFSATHIPEANSVLTETRENRKSENAKRSEPNIGKLPGLTNPARPGISATAPTSERRFSHPNTTRATHPAATTPTGCRVFLR